MESTMPEMFDVSIELTLREENFREVTERVMPWLEPLSLPRNEDTRLD